MRTKIISALAAIFMAASIMAAFTTAPANSATHSVAKKAKHDLTANAKEIGTSDKFKAFGMVPTYAGKKITIQRKVNKGPYLNWKKTKTKAGSGKFSEPIFGGKRGSTVCYKVVVPKTKDYKVTKKVVGCIETI